MANVTSSVRYGVSVLIGVALLVALATGGAAAVGDVAETSHIEQVSLGADDAESASTANGSVNVSLVSATDSAAPGENVTYDIVVAGPDAGVSSYDVVVDLDGEDVASIVDAEHDRTDGFHAVTIAEDGTSVQLEQALGDATYEPADETVLGNVTVSADDVGNASVTVDDESDINDLDSEAYDITATPPGQLTVAEDVLEGTLAVEPASSDAVIDFTRSYDVVLENAEEGVSSFDVSVSLDSTDSAAIVDADTVGDDVLDDVTIDDEGRTLTVTQAQLNDTVEPDASVTLITVDIEMQAIGAVDVAVDEGTVTGVDGTSYTLATESGSIDVIEPPEGPDVTGDGTGATDTTGDGKTNDVRGDGEFGVADVQELFDLIASGEIETVEGADEYFDFTDDDDVGIGDVQALFTEFREQSS